MSSISQTQSDIHPPVWLELVREKVERVRYGVIELVVHDGHVTQIETTEKTRVPKTRD